MFRILGTTTLLSFFLLASCANATATGSQDTLLAEEVPLVVTESKSGDFQVDPATSLAWSNRISVELDYSETKAYCTSLGKNWRLPTVGELQTTYSGEGDSRRVKPALSKGLPDEGVLFTSEEIPRIDDRKQPWVVEIASGRNSVGNDHEGYARCVHGPKSRQQKPFPMPTAQLMGERWWEQEDACPSESVPRGTPGLMVACKAADGKIHGRSTQWTREERTDSWYRNETLHGKTTKWRADGLKISEVMYGDGELHGLSTYWHANGEKASESDYSIGQLDGRDVKWRTDGLKSSDVSYRQGKQHGLATYWYENGEVSSQSSYVDGKLHGKTLKSNPDGSEASSISYRNGERHGRSIYWSTSGDKLSDLTFANGKLHGKAVRWRADGVKKSEATYRNGVLHGTSRSYFANGEMSSESSFASGLMHGVHQRWDERGNLLGRTRYDKARIIDQQHHENGMPRDGRIETKHANGVISYVGVFEEGRARGRHYGYHANGKQKFERNYNAKGILSGRSVDWHPNGKAREVSRYVRGALHGERAIFTANGEPKARLIYRHGILTK